MFSVIFPGQGSQTVGMAKDLYEKFKQEQKEFQETKANGPKYNPNSKACDASDVGNVNETIVFY